LDNSSEGPFIDQVDLDDLINLLDGSPEGSERGTGDGLGSRTATLTSRPGIVNPIDMANSSAESAVQQQGSMIDNDSLMVNLNDGGVRADGGGSSGCKVVASYISFESAPSKLI